jgi:hypothetical protein
MKFLSLLFILTLSIPSFAQEFSFDTDDDGMAYYSDVVPVSGANSATLYKRSIEWIHKYYANPTGVIQTNDSAGMLVEGKARFRLNTYDKKGNVMAGGGFVAYQLAMHFKDGKYKYEIKRIRWEQASYYDVTKWNDTNQVDYNKELHDFYIKQTVEYIEKTLDDMIEYMAKGAEVKSNEW